jgi:hypothetical protein
MVLGNGLIKQDMAGTRDDDSERLINMILDGSQVMTGPFSRNKSDMITLGTCEPDWASDCNESVMVSERSPWPADGLIRTGCAAFRSASWWPSRCLA